MMPAPAGDTHGSSASGCIHRRSIEYSNHYLTKQTDLVSAKLTPQRRRHALARRRPKRQNVTDRQLVARHQRLGAAQRTCGDASRNKLSDDELLVSLSRRETLANKVNVVIANIISNTCATASRTASHPRLCTETHH